jgi:predicted PurR-regulated permease PerM
MNDPFFRIVKQGVAIFTYSCIILLLAVSIYTTRWIAFALLIGLGFGVLLTPLINYTSERWKLSKAVTLPVVVLGIFGTIGGIGYLSFRLVSEQFDALVAKWPDFLHQVNALTQRFPWLKNIFDASRVGNSMEGAANTVLKTLESSVGTIGGFFFILAISLYLASNPEEYLDEFLSVLPAYSRPKAARVLHECASVLRRWFVSQLIAMVIVGTLVAVGLKIIGSSYWFILSIFTGGLELISFLGPAVAFVTATVVTLASQPDKALIVMVFFLVVLRLEGDLIIPMVMRGRIKLSPIPLLTLLLMLGTWFGVLGLFAAAPLLAVLRTIYVMLYVPMMDQKRVPSPDGVLSAKKYRSRKETYGIQTKPSGSTSHSGRHKSGEHPLRRREDSQRG